MKEINGRVNSYFSVFGTHSFRDKGQCSMIDYSATYHFKTIKNIRCALRQNIRTKEDDLGVSSWKL